MNTASCNGAPQRLESSDDCVRGLKRLRAHEHGELIDPGPNYDSYLQEAMLRGFHPVVHARTPLVD